MIIASKFTLSLNVIVKMTKNLFRSTKNLRLVSDRSLSHIEGSGSKGLLQNTLGSRTDSN